MKVICIDGVAHFETADGVVWGDKFSADEREKILNLANILRIKIDPNDDPFFAVSSFILQNYALEPKRCNVNYNSTAIGNKTNEDQN